MTHSNLKWILSELPYLEAQELIDASTREKLAGHYQSQMSGVANSGGSKLLSVLSIIGGVLVGLGFILLVAYNWELYSREVKTFFALAPLMVIQGIILFGKFRENRSTTFNEVTATLLCLTVGASMAILSQTYNIQGELDSYLKLWMLLIIPVVYALRSNMAGFIYFILTLVWVSSAQIEGGSAAWFWFFGGLIIPYYYFQVLKKDRFSSSSYFFSFVFILWILTSVGISLEKAVPGLWIIIYACLVFIIYFAGIKWFDKSGPFNFLGKGGILVLMYLFTFYFFWDGVGIGNFRSEARFNNLGAYFDYLVLAGVVIYCLYIFVKERHLVKKEIGVLAALPILAAVSFVLLSFSGDFAAVIVLVFNLTTLGVGIYLIYHGLRHDSISESNLGMLFVGILILTRFFDIEMGFLVRAVVFLILGSCFIGVNVLLKKRIGGNHEKA